MKNNKKAKKIKHKSLSTEYLSHFTKSFENLINIVKDGFKPNICKELAIDERPTQKHKTFINPFADFFDEEETESQNVKRYIPMVCFCDIPSKFAKTHREIYGQYGILLTKQWAIDHGISPIIYLPENSKLHTIFYNISGLIKKSIDNYSSDVAPMKEEINKLQEYIKAYKKENEKYKYYDEREWRYIPDQNEEDVYLTFEKKDIVRAIVQTKGEKEELSRILREKFGTTKNLNIEIYKWHNR
jgi:hypothetical protein